MWHYSGAVTASSTAASPGAPSLPAPPALTCTGTCDNGGACGQCLMRVAPADCPSPSGLLLLPPCGSHGISVGDLCEAEPATAVAQGDADCGTRYDLDNCGLHDVYVHVFCLSPPATPPPASPSPLTPPRFSPTSSSPHRPPPPPQPPLPPSPSPPPLLPSRTPPWMGHELTRAMVPAAMAVGVALLYAVSALLVRLRSHGQQRRRVTAVRTYELALARAVQQLPRTTCGGERDAKSGTTCSTAGRGSTPDATSAASSARGSDGDDDDAAECCAICLCAFCAGDELRTLPCAHAFHVACIDSWLLGHGRGDPQQPPTCPLCKAVPVCPPAVGVAASDGSPPTAPSSYCLLYTSPSPRDS